MRLVKLQLAGQFTSLPSHWLDGGKLYLDIDDEFELSLDKSVQELNDVNKINTETVFGTSLPGTSKNMKMLGLDFNYNVLDLEITEHDIRVDRGYYTLRHNRLRVVDYTRSTNRIEIEIIDGEDNWLTAIKSIFLNDLPFVPYNITKKYLVDNITFKAKYQAGDEGYWFPLINFGAFAKKDEISEGDFRPCVHVAKVWELAFGLIKRSYEFPLLETEVGARLGMYALKENITDDPALLEQLEFKAQLSSDFIDNGAGETKDQTLVFDKEIYDKGDNYDPTTGKFTTPGYCTFIYKCHISFLIGDAGWRGGTFIDIWLRLVHSDGTYENLNGANYASHGDALGINEDVTLQEDIYVEAGDHVEVHYRRQGEDLGGCKISVGATFTNTPISLILNPGDKFDVQKNLRHDPVLDVMKSIIQLKNIKILEERHTGIIHFLTTFDTNYFGDVVSGYFKNVTKSFLSLQVQDEEIITTPLEITKNVLYKFKDSTDAKIIEKKLQKWEQPFVKFIDNGFDKEKETELRENQYFEPTVNRDVLVTQTVRNQTIGKNIDMPWMVDNLDGKSSTKIGPRILIFYGLTELYNRYTKNEFDSIDQVQLYYLGELRTVFPYAFQKPNYGTSVDFSDFTIQIPEWRLVFGDEENDNFNLFYRKAVRELENRHKSKIKLLLADKNYFPEYFQDRSEIKGLEGSTMGRILGFGNYNPEKGFVDADFIPDLQASEICDEYTAPNPCDNRPLLKYTKDDTEYTLYQAGVINSPTTSIVIEWKYKDEDDDMYQENVTIGNPTRLVVARMTVTYSDGCATQVKSIQIDPCGNRPKICFSLVNSCLSIGECGSHNSEIDSILIQYSETQQEPYQYKTYNDCIDVTTLSSTIRKIHAKITVTYVGGCSTLSVEDDFILTKLRTDECPKFDDVIDPPSVIVVTTALGFELWRIGSYNCCAYDDFIEYRQKGTLYEWRKWVEGQTALPHNQDYEVRRKVSWCADGCRPWCGPVVYALRGCVGTVNIADTITSCVHTLKWQHPDNPTNEWKVNIYKDQDFHVPELKTYLETNCAGVITESYVKRILWDRWNFRTQYQITWQPGHKVENMEVHQNAAGVLSSTITIPINVTYNSGDDNDALTQALITAVESYLSSTYAATNTVHYDFDVEILGTGTNRTLKLIWWAKEVYASTWYGAQAPTDLLYMRDELNVQSTVASTKLETQKIATSQQKSINITPCGTELRVRFTANTNKFIDDDLSNFDTLTPNALVAIDDTVETVITETCNKHVLTATFTCAGTATYIWKYGSSIISEDNTVTVSGVGKIITLLATCTVLGVSCTFKKELKLT